ncbi:MAG TPA: zinc-dependent alcohol dehydrogenase family protein [Candidatus Limnocylindria bacterium]|jgi:NADPH2:quinone reductase|nr:zinc-dependent alcohol dehydrogenase family protein [Candidatus Limnocylindria bacterium]
MRALVLQHYGEPLKATEIAKPTPRRGEVLVRIKASGLNPLDCKIQAGSPSAAHAQVTLPAVLGIDLAGVVEAVGPNVTAFEPGDEVYGMTGGVGGLQGSLAEFASVDADLLALKPANLGMREAAAMPLIFITAWEGLIDHARLRAETSVLVHGGAGGVGSMAVQLARARGAAVFATDRPDRLETIAALGATPIDYTTTAVEDYVATHTAGEGFDVVYDTIGGPSLDAAFTAVRAYEGRVVSSLGFGTHALAPLSFRAATYSGVYTLLPMLTGKGRARHGAILREAAKLVENGLLRPLLDERSFTLETVGEAYAALEAGTLHGKAVVTLDD